MTDKQEKLDFFASTSPITLYDVWAIYGTESETFAEIMRDEVRRSAMMARYAELRYDAAKAMFLESEKHQDP